jgi:hypothetical protein
MSVIRKHGKKWQVMIRRNDSPHITKSFLHKEAAQEWSRETEVNIEKGLYVNVSQSQRMTKRIENARAYSGAPKKEEGLFESIITNLGKDKKPQKAKLAREISQTIKPSNIDEYIKIRTEVAETSPSTLRIVQQEDPDMKQGIGALYKST